VRARNRLLQVSKLLKVDNGEPEIKSLAEWVELFPQKDPRVQYVFLGYSLRTTDDFFAGLPDVDSADLKTLLFTEDLSDLFSELESYREDAREEHFRLRHIIPTLYRLVGSTAPDFGVLWRCDRGLRRGERRNLPEIGDNSRVVLRYPALGFSVVHFERKDLLGTRRGWIAIDNDGKPLRTGADIADTTIQGAAERVLSAINTKVKSWALYSDSAQWAEYTMGDSDEQQEHLLVLDDFPHRFETNPHYDVDNVLLHVRTSVEYSRNGLRCLVVDELQSDWLQKRADQSQKFRDGNDEFRSMPWSSDWYELGLKVVLQLAAKSQVDAIVIASSGMQKELYGNHFTNGGEKFYDNVLPNKLAKLVKPWALPQTFQKLAFEKRPITILRTEEGRYEVLNPGGESALGVCSTLLEARKLIAMSELMCDGPEVPVFSISAEFREEVVSKGLMLFG